MAFDLSGRRQRGLPAKAKQPPLGTGQRFAALTNKLADRPGVTNPKALAAYIGRRKYGKAGMAALSAKGRKSGV
jgi:hypothetical protein